MVLLIPKVYLSMTFFLHMFFVGTLTVCLRIVPKNTFLITSNVLFLRSISYLSCGNLIKESAHRMWFQL